MQNDLQTIAHEFIQMDKDAGLNYPHEAVEKLLNTVIAECANRISLNNHQPEKVLSTIHETLKNMGFIYKYQPSDQPHDNTMLLDFLEKKINCRGYSTLYIALGQALNLPLVMVQVPKHVFIRWQLDNDSCINWETTAGLSLNDEEYINKHRISPHAIDNGVFLKNLDINGIYGTYYFSRSLIHKKKQEYKDALTDLNRAIDFNPKSLVYHLQKIDIYISMAKKIINLPGGPITLKVVLKERITNESQSILKEALDELENIEKLNLDPNYPSLYSKRANIYFWIGDIERCLDLINENIERFPNDPRTYIDRAEFHDYHREGSSSFAIAIDKLARSTSAEPDEKLQKDPALIDYTTAIRLDGEKNAEYFQYRGECYEDRGAWKLALEDYKKAMEIEPNNPITCYQLGNSLRETIASKYSRKVHKTAEAQKLMLTAIKYIDTALEYNPTYAAAYASKGLAFVVLPNKIVEGIELIKKAISLNPYSFSLNVDLFYAYCTSFLNRSADEPELSGIVALLRDDFNFNKNIDAKELDAEMRKIIVSYDLDQFESLEDDSDEEKNIKEKNRKKQIASCAQDLFLKIIDEQEPNNFQKYVSEERLYYGLQKTVERCHEYIKSKQFSLYAEKFINAANNLDSEELKSIIIKDNETETDVCLFYFLYSVNYPLQIEKKVGIENLSLEAGLVMSKIIEDSIVDTAEEKMKKEIEKVNLQKGQSGEEDKPILEILEYNKIELLIKEYNKDYLNVIEAINKTWSDEYLCLKMVQRNILTSLDLFVEHNKEKYFKVYSELFKNMLIPNIVEG